MSRPPISNINLSSTLTLSECHPTSEHKGAYWLFDDTRGMNLAMGAATPQDAFVEALTYYQGRLLEVEKEHKALKDKVEIFLNQFKETDEWDA